MIETLHLDWSPCEGVLYVCMCLPASLNLDSVNTKALNKQLDAVTRYVQVLTSI